MSTCFAEAGVDTGNPFDRQKKLLEEISRQESTMERESNVSILKYVLLLNKLNANQILSTSLPYYLVCMIFKQNLSLESMEWVKKWFPDLYTEWDKNNKSRTLVD